MKLLREFTDNESVEIIVEGSGANKTHKVKGVFAMSEVENLNKRVYPRAILEREVNAYQDKINSKRSVGELEHPPTPQINLERISHLIESLYMEGNNAIGTAKILDTNMGRVAKDLINEGIKLGISTRGLGTMSGQRVNPDYRLICADLVFTPSAQKAVLESILENKEWMVQGDSIIEVAQSELRRRVDKHGSKDAFEALDQYFKRLIKGI